ncbi:MAG: S8 family serine peptidase [Steroidobacteraceae bacterium]
MQAPSAIRHCLIGILAAFSIASTHAAAGTNERNPVRTHPTVASEPSEQRILVKLRSSAAAAAHVQALQLRPNQINAANGTMQALATRASLTFKQSREITNGLHLLQVQSATGESAAATLARLRADPDVESAEIDQRRFAHAMPNDPLFTGQWYEQATQPSGIDALTAWDTTTGRNDVVIAELDTGVRYDHPDLLAATANGRLLAGYDFVTDATVANDGDGRDADASDPGDWITSADAATTKFTGCTVENSSWHGTRVAGILGALSNNATGITGITWLPKILPVRVLGKCGGVNSDILDAMRWAAGLHVTGVPDNTHPAQIINMSLGGSGGCSPAEQTVINEVVAAGVTVVISAGNEGGPVDAPANCVGVAGIAGIRQIGTKVGFSSLGPEAALAAPAGNCVNASGACLFSIDTSINNGTTTPTTNGYTDQLNPNLGTSFSSPIVAGIAGLMTSVNANLKPSQLIARLKEGAKTFPVSSDPAVPNCHVPASSTDLQTAECNCTTTTCGAGMANAPGALKAALRPIAAIAVPATVAAGQNVSLAGTGSAAACSHTISTYAWSNVGNATNPIQGANTATATVVAPATGSITVRLTVTDDAGRQDMADVVISGTAATTTAPANANSGKCPAVAMPVAVAVTPATASVQVGNGMQTFAAAVTNTANTAVTWSVNGVTGGNATVGMISVAGVYTAPATAPTPATVTVKATSAADAMKSATAQITITTPIAVSITPTSATVQTGMTQAFSAMVTGSSNTSVNWSVNGIAGGNATLGMISTTGVYTAPMAVPSPAAVTVTAVSAADSTKSASAQTTVAAAPASGGSSTPTTGGSSSTSGNSMTSGSGGGGGPMDPLTLFACTLVVGFAAYRRGVASR